MSEETPLPPAGDENTNLPAAGWRACVPSGDHRLVLSTIDDQVAAAKNARRAKRAADGKGAAGGKAKDAFFENCIDQTGGAIKVQVMAATVPTDEAEAERALDSFQTRLLAASFPADDDGVDSDDGSLSSVDDVDEEIEFDDEEILDREAHEQARRLRIRAREISARVVSLREETAGRALEMTRRDLSELLRVHGFSEEGEHDDVGMSGGEGAGAAEQEEEGVEERRREADLSRMRVALRTLASSLREVDSGLAGKLDSMKETIGTIDSSVEKYQKLSQGDESVLSRTEKALLAKEKPTVDVEELAEEDDSQINPDKDLARLLAGVL